MKKLLVMVPLFSLVHASDGNKACCTQLETCKKNVAQLTELAAAAENVIRSYESQLGETEYVSEQMYQQAKPQEYAVTSKYKQLKQKPLLQFAQSITAEDVKPVVCSETPILQNLEKKLARLSDQFRQLPENVDEQTRGTLINLRNEVQQIINQAKTEFSRERKQLIQKLENLETDINQEHRSLFQEQATFGFEEIY